MNDFDIKQLFARSDFSRGTEAFAEGLLGRALAELPQEEGVTRIADEDLEWLAAAGPNTDVSAYLDFDE